jgi:hypothetical protein
VVPASKEIESNVIENIPWDVPKSYKFTGASGFTRDRVRIDVSDFFSRETETKIIFNR